MKRIGQSIRLGKWSVSPENAPDFINAWKSSADWLAKNLSDGGEAFLLQDSADPGQLTSFAVSSSPELEQEVKALGEFQDLWSKGMALCEDVQPHKVKVAANSGS